MNKLFTVTATFQYVVAAEDLASACEVAEEYVQDAFSELPYRSDAIESVFPYRNDARGWDDMCFPYGAPTEKRIGEYLKESA